MTHRLINWTLAGVISLAMGSLYRLDGPSDHSTELAQAADLEAAIRAEDAQERFERAAQEMCGENSAWRLQPDGAVQCFTKRGAKTRKVSL